MDGTLGRAGHSLEIVRRLTTGRLIALDRDETAIEAANRRLGDYLDKVTLVHSNFSALDSVLYELGVHGVDGMLFDLGVSSPQPFKYSHKGRYLLILVFPFLARKSGQRLARGEIQGVPFLSREANVRALAKLFQPPRVRSARHRLNVHR